MKYDIIVARAAKEQFERLDARWRSSLKSALRDHLQFEPRKESRSRIKRLRGLRKPRYRLRVDAMRVFFDVDDASRRVEILAFVFKCEAEDWLDEHGVPE